MPVTKRTRRPAFPPGEHIAEELEARGWTQGDLAKVIGRPLQAVNAIIRGRKAITARTAVELGAAFGTGPEVWLNLETAYQLGRAGPADPAIAERAALLCPPGDEGLVLLDDTPSEDDPVHRVPELARRLGREPGDRATSIEIMNRRDRPRSHAAEVAARLAQPKPEVKPTTSKATGQQAEPKSKKSRR